MYFLEKIILCKPFFVKSLRTNVLLISFLFAFACSVCKKVLFKTLSI